MGLSSDPPFGIIVHSCLIPKGWNFYGTRISLIPNPEGVS